MSEPRTIHFVYATPYRLQDKIAMRLFKRKLSHPEWDAYHWPSPVKAPLSITFQIAQRLSARYRIKLYDLKERAVIKPREGDILLAHAWPDRQSIVWNALSNPDFGKKFLISPYNHDSRQVGWMEDAVKACDAYFAICGDYWMETFDEAVFAEYRHKVIHLNMALDMADYPLVKQGFSPPGKRKFFYIGRHGRFGDEKGVRLLENLSEKIPDFQGGYICPDGDIKGWRKISPPTRLTPDFMVKVAADYDVFINMSRADAQATTVLEAMSWGFPVACTRESGYTDESLFLLELDNERANILTLEKIQRMGNEELKEISSANRAIVAGKYSWKRFLEVIENNLTG